MLWRIATGRLAEKYGEEFFDFDCYIRQFVREDGKLFEDVEEDEEDDEEDEEE